MNTKLTLTIEETVVKKAKIYAKKKGDSLSGMIENYLKAVTAHTDLDSIKLTPVVKSLKGSFKAPAKFDYKKELTKELSKKHL
ncbi:MAG TPA: hypothetical protein DIT07_13900 [Sphingobacteriaceae bacterium]|nr:hypothetical protein [Sphingobacteriaceae bacterium]